ncbi:Resolvase/invertase-type recombinase catalytic domain-containing protein [Vibrio crassostreae]|nr:Resolvase/invertase-type recombinase catalytic domain-containing protein [Vibrio crassostreae]
MTSFNLKKIVKRYPLVMYRSSSESDVRYKKVTSSVLDTLKDMKVNRIIITNCLTTLMDESLWYQDVAEMMKADGTLLIFADYYVFRDLSFISKHFEVRMMLDENKLYKSSRDVDLFLTDYPENENPEDFDQKL